MSVIDFEQARCNRIRSYLDAHLNNEKLPAQTTQEVLTHLAGCQLCSKALADRARVKSLLQRAVLRDAPSPGLRHRIQKDIRRRATPYRWTHWALAAAAAFVLFVGSVGVVRLLNSRSERLRTDLSSLGQGPQLLKIGLGDHVYCAIDHGLANRRFTAEEMANKMGPDYVGVVNAVKERIPSDYEIVVGHRCHVDGREFVHLILRDPSATVSLIVTRKNGKSFAREGLAPLFEESGIRVYQSRLGEFEVAGFETRDHLVFVVSTLAKQDNLQIASSLAPVVRNVLDRLKPEGQV